jgi:hypothetical protein
MSVCQALLELVYHHSVLLEGSGHWHIVFWGDGSSLVRVLSLAFGICVVETQVFVFDKEFSYLSAFRSLWKDEVCH